MTAPIAPSNTYRPELDPSSLLIEYLDGPARGILILVPPAEFHELPLNQPIRILSTRARIQDLLTELRYRQHNPIQPIGITYNLEP